MWCTSLLAPQTKCFKIRTWQVTEIESPSETLSFNTEIWNQSRSYVSV